MLVFFSNVCMVIDTPLGGCLYMKMSFDEQHKGALSIKQDKGKQRRGANQRWAAIN
jgi:hypothetical protein